MTDLQHYPTPKALAELAWSKFKNRNITRLLEPSAGKGDLVLPRKPSNWNQLPFKWDAIEMNPGHHPALRELGATVVGYDFLAFGNCSIYSHILLNPPVCTGRRTRDARLEWFVRRRDRGHRQRRDRAQSVLSRAPDVGPPH